MPCDTAYLQAMAQRQEQRMEELERQRAAAQAELARKLATGEVTLRVNELTGNLELVGWAVAERAGWQDGCVLAAMQAQGLMAYEMAVANAGLTAEQARELVVRTHGH